MTPAVRGEEEIAETPAVRGRLPPLEEEDDEDYDEDALAGRRRSRAEFANVSGTGDAAA